MINSYPVRLLHVIYPMMFGIMYVLFTVIYWLFDETNNVLYPNILDWNHPGKTIAIFLSFIFVFIPLLQLIWYGIYQLKLLLFRKMKVADL